MELLISGHSYPLQELFSEQNRIVIPDLQRDYCWGDKHELIGSFLDSLIQNIQSEELQIGMIYAYNKPKNHIQLCDGQQRLTSLYLILGMLCKKTKCEALKDCLISEYELNQDDKEPRLQYAIRESTLYFLSDLVWIVYRTRAPSANSSSSPWANPAARRALVFIGPCGHGALYSRIRRR